MALSSKNVWKPIEGYNGVYLINQNGDIKNAKTNLLKKQQINQNGYKIITLYKNISKKTAYG